MSLFNNRRLTNDTFKLDAERMRRGWYSDKYFENVHRMLTALAASGYCYDGRFPRELAPRHELDSPGAAATARTARPAFDIAQLDIGNLMVEVQFFTRRKGTTVVVGVDKALAMLRHCAGYAEEKGIFIETWDRLQVYAVEDGDVVHFPPKGNAGDGDPRFVEPVMRVRGRYRDFALLETPVLGALSRGSRIATNVYKTMVAARGKPVLFFPARFDAHEVQAADGYAYDIGVQRFNLDYGEHVASLVSTDAQGDYWGGRGGGTVPHAIIACFLGDTAAAMLAFSATLPVDVPRIALVDFNNDSVQDSLRTIEAMYSRYRQLMEEGREEDARKYVLFGVRLDTSSSLRDVAVSPIGDPYLDLGVNPRLVFAVRRALDNAWRAWDLPEAWVVNAQAYCENTQIAVSGGFNPDKISRFEKLGVPVDYYGVGSSLMSNDASVGTNTDFTADLVRVLIEGEWVDLAKTGRRPCHNDRMERVT